MKLQNHSLAWLLDRIFIKINLFRREIINHNDQLCTGGCGMNEDMNRLFAKCDFFCKIWYLVSHWLGFVIVSKGTMSDHLAHFGGLGGFSKHVRLALNII